MTNQTNVLELAKQGNPQAIASLMNLALQSKGAIAKATLNNGCLHIILDSEQPLSQQTIVNFVRSGLTNLAAKPIQSVEIYARKVGQEEPVWTERFQVDHSAPSHYTDLPASVENRKLRLPSPRTFTTSETPTNLSFKKLTTYKSAKIKIPANFHTLSKQTRYHLRFFTSAVLPQVKSSKNRYVFVSAAVLAFVCGGVVAVIVNSQAAGTSQSTAALKSAIALEQINAKQYLAQMSKAQKRFYQNSGRFAATLEELERSAAIMFQSAHYTYKLTIRDQIQSELRATPKVDGMKSYTSLVMLSQAADGSSAIAGKICETDQPSDVPPITPQMMEVGLQCPVNSTNVPF